MTTEENIYIEVKNSLKSYDEAGLIDDISLRTWLHSEIKRFGSNLMTDTDDIIQVKRGKAFLPKDFWSLKESWKYELSHYCAENDEPRVLKAAGKDYLLNTSCDCNASPTNYVKEEFRYKEKEIQIYYNKPERLRLAPGFNRRAVEKDCINLPNRVQKKESNTIRLNNGVIHAEFTEGFIYIIYRAMPMDEEGNIILPETQHDRLRLYLEAFLKRKLIQEWWLNNDDPNLGNKLQFLKQEEEDAFGLAMSEAKAGILDPAVWKTLRNNNRQRHRKFERLIPNLTHSHYK